MASRPTTTDQVSKAQIEFNQARARLLDAKARHKATERRDRKKRDDRRKILAGACVLSLVQTDTDFAAKFWPRLDAFLTRDTERGIFDELLKLKS